ncbi:hypothetical protein CPB84DRAFT_1962255 [Gymnopilus junonius]|uniref:Uncharacterized protein n=1 Tax=Gymnopilus junonius TaxID=109634 RepID=A0A9P5NQT1_GYMJU|nr:hypothetical protein CPB84DRAFT_1962255 [Gymnopilus junonius]
MDSPRRSPSKAHRTHPYQSPSKNSGNRGPFSTVVQTPKQRSDSNPFQSRGDPFSSTSSPSARLGFAASKPTSARHEQPYREGPDSRERRLPCKKEVDDTEAEKALRGALLRREASQANILEAHQVISRSEEEMKHIDAEIQARDAAPHREAFKVNIKHAQAEVARLVKEKVVLVRERDGICYRLLLAEEALRNELARAQAAEEMIRQAYLCMEQALAVAREAEERRWWAEHAVSGQVQPLFLPAKPRHQYPR